MCNLVVQVATGGRDGQVCIWDSRAAEHCLPLWTVSRPSSKQSSRKILSVMPSESVTSINFCPLNENLLYVSYSSTG